MMDCWAPQRCQVEGCTYQTPNYVTKMDHQLQTLQLHVQMVHSTATSASMFCQNRKFDIRVIFIESCKRNNLEKVKSCVNLGVDINTKIGDVNGDEEWTGLTAAAQHNSVEVMQWLLSQPRVHVNITSRTDASFRGNKQKESEDDWTPLMFACHKGHDQIVNILVKVPSIDLNFQDMYGRGAAHWAASASTKCVKVLTAASGIDWNLQDRNGWTPLCYALEKACQAGTAGWKGKTPEWAIERLQLILEIPGIQVAGLMTKKIGWEYKSILGDKIITQCGVNCFELLLNHGEIDWNEVDKDGNTPLMQAIKKKKFEIAKLLLLEPGVDIHVVNNTGKTAKMIAVEMKVDDLVNLIDNLTMSHMKDFKSSYCYLREELYNLTTNKAVEFTTIKKLLTIRLGKNVLSRRKVEKIQSLKRFIHELENNLSIVPEKKEIDAFVKIVKVIREELPSVIEKEYYRRIDLLNNVN